MIKLKPGVDKVTARISDIVENPKKLKFLPNVEAALLPQMYNLSLIHISMNGVGCRATARIMGVSLNTILRHLKNSGRSR